MIYLFVYFLEFSFFVLFKEINISQNLVRGINEKGIKSGIK